MASKPRTRNPRKTVVHQLRVLANMIESEVSYFNGWTVPSEQMEVDCLNAAKNILKYLRRYGIAES